MAKYLVEPIGAAFREHEFSQLANRFEARSDEGYEFHSVIRVSKAGCLGTNEGETYLAVYRKAD